MDELTPEIEHDCVITVQLLRKAENKSLADVVAEVKDELKNISEGMFLVQRAVKGTSVLVSKDGTLRDTNVIQRKVEG